MLRKYKLLDLSRIVVGPYASMILSDFGVETIKIQSAEGDPSRKWGPPWSHDTSAYFQSVNRNKRSICLDFKKLKHKEVFYRMIEQSDAVIENFIPGTTEKLGINYQKVKSFNKKIVYCSVSGYGDIGTMKNKPAFDNIMQAETGFMHLTGSPQTQPFKLGFAIIDVVTGLYASNAILAGLLHRQQTGQGIHLKTSLYQCGMAALINQGSNYLNGGIDPSRMGNHHPNIVPYGVYQAQDGLILICCGTQKQYESLIKCLKLEPNEKFKTNQMRVIQRQAFDQYLSKSLKQKKSINLIEQLLEVGVPCGKINSISQAFNSKISRELGIVQETSGVKYVRNPIRSELEQVNCSPPPKLNQHGEEILKQLGYSCQQIDQIKNS